jgi:UDP-2-acetamido-2-deoxy-ribo-hexuluronate aminotransferase
MIPHFGLARQYKNLKDELLDSTDKVLRSGMLMNGAYTAALETWIAMRTNCAFALTVHSGTQALEIMAHWVRKPYMSVYELPPIVRIPNISYVATLNAFLNAGFVVELIDTDKNGLMRVNDNTNLLGDMSKITCMVGLYGANPNPYNTIGTSYDLVDGAQHWLVADTVASGMAISFDPTKNLNASGNGGAIVTNDRDLYDFAYSYRSNGKHSHNNIGTNSRMSELDCAHVLVRSNYIDKWQWRRKEIRYHYLDEFKNLDVRCLSRDFSVHADQKFVIYTDKRDQLKRYLSDAGIEAKVHYENALSELPIAKHIDTKPDMLSTSVNLTRGLLSLPIYPELSDAEVEYIADTVKKFFTC